MSIDDKDIHAQIDVSHLAELRDLFKADFPASLRSFLDNATRYVQEIGDAIAADRRQVTEDVAHKLKSSAAMFGLVAVSEICAEIEDVAEELNQSALIELHMKLERLLTSARALLETVFQTPDAVIEQWQKTVPLEAER